MRTGTCFAVVLLLLVTVAAAQEVPAGTVLPVMLNSGLDVRHARPGQLISGNIMQDVPLPDGASIPKGARVVGHVVSASVATAGSPSRLTVKFDRIVTKELEIPVTVHLRALGSMNEVFESKIPTNSLDDYGTSTSDWNTVQIGGAGVYRGNGQVVSGDQVVGKSTDYGAVTAKLLSTPKSACHGEDDGHEYALWVFSPWACGVYGFSDLQIIHTGRTSPVGEIELESGRDVRVNGGSGWLLRVEGAAGK